MAPRELAALVLRILGWFGLGLLLMAMFLSDFLAHAPAGTVTGSPLSPPSGRYPFGTDIMGRDVLSETLHGLAQTGRMAIAGALIAIFLGGVFGVVAARMPQPLARSLRRLFGVFAAIPGLLLCILFAGLLGPSLVAVAAGLAVAPLGFVRSFDHADTDSTHSDYARATGIPALTLLRRDLTYEFRFLIGEVVARALAAVVIILSTATFLGFGAPARDLGFIIASSKPVLYTAWWAVLFPALALMVFVLSARLAAGLEEGERA